MASFNASVSDQPKVPPEEGNRTFNQTGNCTPMSSPALGTLKLLAGNGRAVGTVMILTCPSNYRAVSGGRIICVQNRNSTQWSGGVPECKPLSRYGDHGLRIAVLASLISSAVILLMSIFFITSCMLKQVEKDEKRKLERKRRREHEELWKQMSADEQRESFYNYNGIYNNNNNNSNLGQEKSFSLTVPSIKSLVYSDLQSANRHQENYPDSTKIHHLQGPNKPISLNQVFPETAGQEFHVSAVNGQILHETHM